MHRPRLFRTETRHMGDNPIWRVLLLERSAGGSFFQEVLPPDPLQELPKKYTLIRSIRRRSRPGPTSLSKGGGKACCEFSMKGVSRGIFLKEGHTGFHLKTLLRLSYTSHTIEIKDRIFMIFHANVYLCRFYFKII